MAELPLEHVAIEPEADHDGPSPAAFVLHGRGADERDLLPIAQKFPDALRVISLRAPDRLQGGYTWYELDLSGGGLHQSQPHAEEFRRSLDLVAESVETAIDTYDLDPDRLGLFGFSQGAITSLSLLLESPTRYAWIVASHGYLAESHASVEPDGIEGTPVFVGAGRNDRIIPAHRSEAAADRLDELGADVTFEAFDAPHGVGPEELRSIVEFVSTHFRSYRTI